MSETKPGSLILEHYFPDATEAEREEVIRRLKRLVKISYKILGRVAREEKEAKWLAEERETK